MLTVTDTGMKLLSSMPRKAVKFKVAGIRGGHRPGLVILYFEHPSSQRYLYTVRLLFYSM